MRSQRWCVIALTMAITLAFPAAGFGDSSPSPTPRPTSKVQSSTAAYKTALSLFKVEVKLRELNRKKINRVFIQAVHEAFRKEKISTKLAKSANAELENRLQRKSDILLANKIRAASILAMGDAPVLPADSDEAEESDAEEAQSEEPSKRDKKESEPTKRAKPEKVDRTP